MEGFNLESDIYENTQAMADLEYQLATGQITAEEYAKSIEKLTAAQENNGARARNNATAWLDASKDVTTAKEKVEKLTDELNTLKKQGATEAEIKVKQDEIKEASEELSDALKKKYELEEPTEVTVTAALDDIDAQMEQWKN